MQYKKPRPATKSLPAEKPGLHPRNPHRAPYDFDQLIRSCPALREFVITNPFGNASIDFANPKAVKTLNQALLAHFYATSRWDIPPGYLCPPIPGRADYIHHLADLLASCNGGVIPSGASIRVLDIGVGANCIYPIIGLREYGWRFLGSDIDQKALECAQHILANNPGLGAAIQLRLQEGSGRILKDLLQAGEVFDLSLCNPPFHASAQEAMEGSRRKCENLGLKGAPVLNFGGQAKELWCQGGESAFICRMVQESALIPAKCLWFTSLVAKEATLPAVKRALKQAGAVEVRVIPMAQGQKKSRFIAWTFLSLEERESWRQRKWQL